ncbi:MAG TPA: hypothetical protein VH207_12710 [Chthoniobacterales bacterium]|nr:hypothetical protein [Chthoniobacterales bacterium]
MVKFYALIFALVTLTFTGCANQQTGTTTGTESSPMNRNNNNGLASYMH